MNIFVVIPAYNEEKKIVSVVQDIHKHGYKNIVLVNDSSKDNTLSVMQKLDVHVLHHVINRGQGAALKTGIDYALSQGADIIVTFDADGQHQAKDIKKLTEPIEKREVEVVLGSRFLDAETKIPFARRIVLFGGKLFLLFLYGIHVSDSQSGLRALSKKAAEEICIRADRMEHCGEILNEIHKKKISFKEVPIHVLYTDYSKKKGQSTLNFMNIGFRLLIKKLFE